MVSRGVVVTHVNLTQSPSAAFIDAEVPSVCVVCSHVFTCTCVAVYLSLEGWMEDELTYLLLE